MIDWRAPELRREIFQRSYSHSLEHRNFPGMVYSMMEPIAQEFNLHEDGRAWFAWLNGNTQNVVTSYQLLEVAPHPTFWKQAVDFWSDNFKNLEWDTDRRHQKSAFGKATEQWFLDYGYNPSQGWLDAAEKGWEEVWKHSIGQPYMGRISAWSMYEYARILLGPEIPDVGSWFLEEGSSRSHRNSLCLLSGHDDAWSWDGDKSELPFLLGLFSELDELAEDLFAEAQGRNLVRGPDCYCTPPYNQCMHEPVTDPNVTRLTMESALCTFKSWHKPNRRYPNVYSDMMYQRILKAEARMGRKFDSLWEIRKKTLPKHLRLEDNPTDPGLAPAKQNLFRETGEVLYIHEDWLDMEPTSFEKKLSNEPLRKDPKW